jgi:hypothetical protein
LWVLSDEAFQVADMDDRDDLTAIATVDIISEQELLDAGLVDCVDSARFDGFPLDGFWLWGMPWGDVSTNVVWGGRSPCGAVGFIAIGLTLAALTLARAARLRRP